WARRPIGRRTATDWSPSGPGDTMSDRRYPGSPAPVAWPVPGTPSAEPGPGARVAAEKAAATDSAARGRPPTRDELVPPAGDAQPLPGWAGLPARAADPARESAPASEPGGGADAVLRRLRLDPRRDELPVRGAGRGHGDGARVGAELRLPVGVLLSHAVPVREHLSRGARLHPPGRGHLVAAVAAQLHHPALRAARGAPDRHPAAHPGAAVVPLHHARQPARPR